jgi:large subunit ribosomal protein L30
MSSTPRQSYFRIVLRRSAIGLPARSSGVLRALGLRKRMSVVYQPVSMHIAGMILKVKELVDVQEVDRALTRAEVKESRRPDPGFWVESRTGEDGLTTSRSEPHNS